MAAVLAGGEGAVASHRAAAALHGLVLDAERQAALEAAGERVLMRTAAHATVAPRRLVRRLAAAGAPYTDRQP